jgi:forkhead box protein N
MIPVLEQSGMKLSPPPSSMSSAGEEDDEMMSVDGDSSSTSNPTSLKPAPAPAMLQHDDSLSFSCPEYLLSQRIKAEPAEEDDEDAELALSVAERLTQSCFSQLRVERVKREELMSDADDEDEDEELRSLAWLQDNNLLKNLQADCVSPVPDEHKENTLGLNGSTHPPHIPYNPFKHVSSKPPYSFSCLIFMAIENCPDKRLPVKEIYNWILTNFPYFQNAASGWKNSVRHNLSLNKCFKKVEKEKGSVSIGSFAKRIRALFH